MVKNWLINTIILNSFKKDNDFYLKNICNIKSVQEQILTKILEKNKGTEFGKKYDFSSISDSTSYKKNIPITNYTTYSPYVFRMQDQDNNLLTKDPILVLEPTSGTDKGTKLIPYTSSLKSEFLKAINTWLYDLYTSFPRVKMGKCYWSISPLPRDKKEYQGNIPIGFQDDSEYLDVKGEFLRMLYAVPPEIKHLKSYKNFQYTTSFFLLSSKDLVFISVWNPTFFLLIIECILQNYESLFRDIHDGVLNLPEKEETGYLKPFIKKNKSRAIELKNIWKTAKNKPFQKIWKHLNLISCWTDSYSKYHAARLAKYFPKTCIQGKGLLSTEAFISFPLVEAGGCVPAYTSHFLEFQPEDSVATCGIHELDKGVSYTVIVTTGGGLYRYNLSDKVVVTGFYKNLSLITFIGRDRVIDMIGEKLDEGFISQAIVSILDAFKIEASFLLVAPGLSDHHSLSQLEFNEDSSVYYSLFLETDHPLPLQLLKKMAEQIDQSLSKNFHYDYARKLGQVKHFKIIPVQEDLPDWKFPPVFLYEVFRVDS